MVFLHWGAFQILKTEHKGLNDLLIYGHSSASEGDLTRYAFDGTNYQAVENEVVSSADFKSRISPEPVGDPTYLSVADIEGTAPHLPASPNSARQLTLIDANDSQMDPILRANFPGLENIDGYQELRRSFLLVRNDTPYNVDAFRIEWDVEAPTESGYSVVGAASFARDPFQPGPENQPIAPGGVRLLLEQGGIMGPAEWNTPLRDFTIQAIKAAPRRPTNGAKPVMDIVIYADGLYVGADHTLVVP